MNNAGGMMEVHMVSSQDENRVKKTISPEGRKRKTKVHSLMLEKGVHYEIKLKNLTGLHMLLCLTFKFVVELVETFLKLWYLIQWGHLNLFCLINYSDNLQNTKVQSFFFFFLKHNFCSAAWSIESLFERS